ncbi:hypothetical protein [Blastomonas sp.]|uniref:hypothetical protein n=1 Tax=Blastomonas sp. TaxID=1909299 RepID=UPI0026396C74|nr:hypothetical protein [Blastomonas sp.]MDM7956186.1 hypothetical protein [Blastomonas sp.]
MIYIWLNIVPILAATFAGLAIGYAWARASGRAIGIGVGIAALIAEFWLVAILAGAVILAPDQAPPWTMALGSAFIIWIGFVLPALVVNLSVGGAGARAIASAAGYWLVTMLVQAAVLQAMGLVPPPAG